MRIHLASVHSYRALVDLSERMDWAPLHAWVELDTLAWLFFKLKHVPDSPANFPHGKWALIQYLSNLLEDEAILEVMASEAAHPMPAAAAPPAAPPRPA